MNFMYIPKDADSTWVMKKLQLEKLEAKETRAMAWEDYFSHEAGKQEREATRKFQERLTAQIHQLSQIRISSRNFELWNTAIERQYYEYIDYSLRQVDMRDTLLTNVYYGLTPLARACTIKDYKLVRLLLQHGADPTMRTPDSPYAFMQSPLHASVADPKVFALLTEYLPAEAAQEALSALDSDGLTLVHAAAQGGFIDVLTTLMDNSMTRHQVNSLTPKAGCTPLHLAVLGGHVNCVALLLKHMDPAVAVAPTADGYNALHLALRPDSAHFHLDSLVECFIAANCLPSLYEAPDPNGATALHLAVCQNLELVALRLIGLGKTPLNLSTRGGLAALHLAVSVENTNVIRALHEHNAMIDVMDDFGQTPLLMAALINHVPSIQALLEFGADPGCQNKEGYTPLHYLASYCTSTETFEMLLACDVDVNCKTEMGNAPLHFAAMKGNEVAAKILVQHGADISLLNEDKRSVVFLARQWGHFPLEEYLKSLLKEPTTDSTEAPSTTEASPTQTRAHRRPRKEKEQLVRKPQGRLLPSLRPDTMTPSTTMLETSWETSSTASTCELSTLREQTPGWRLCMTPYVKRQLYGRVCAPNQTMDLTPEMEDLLRRTQAPPPETEHPQAKHMVRRCKAGVHIPWEATMPLAADTLERRLKPSAKYQLNAAQHVKSMPELRAEFQFARKFVWNESSMPPRSRHEFRSMTK
ncbi:hypothetical protein Ae201684P_005385 [Aphanomyces euteiches]|uniref:Uncharacterized protein n=1 Tax=Aphanomyces euteiches TaxID=100861 RepID=A0A6G0X3K4_9STRA|nr:hypothetical protein Ae201684_008831 [Aphanomyces euteiches]KAH9085681.1 hypothetical protein Ae201684P_005385 [Aphanomyces euteiches]KAH9134162.1 hypothetical protein AeRB84_019989 [Aphanomyces euteiches]